MAAAVFAAALIVSPFFLATPLAHVLLSRSAFRDLPYSFGSASLSPLGTLTLHEFAIDDGTQPAGNRLLTSSDVELRFSWLHPFSNHFKSIQLEKASLSIRPGEHLPDSILHLLTGPTVGNSPTHTSSPTGQNPLWIDELLINGTVHFENATPWLTAAQIHPADAFPMQLVAHWQDAAAGPSQEISLVVGDADAAARPSFAAHFTLQPGTGVTSLNIQTLKLTNGQITIPSELLPFVVAAPGSPIEGRFESIAASGMITFGQTISINGMVELRDLSAHTAGNSASVEHFSLVTHADGRWTGTPLHDIAFTGTRCAFDTAQFRRWRVTHGIADLQLNGHELALSNLQGGFLDGDLTASAALDLTALNLTRGLAYLNNFSAARLADALPEPLRRSIPGTTNGKLAARLFLKSFEANRVSGVVEIACPDRLEWALPSAAARPRAILSNLLASANITWNRHRDTLPDITQGRLTADEISFAPAAAREPSTLLTASRLHADFTLARGKIRLDDLAATFPNNGRLTAQVAYSLDTHTLDQSALGLNGIDARTLNAWLPAGWSFNGQLDTEIDCNSTPDAIIFSTSAGLAPTTLLKSPTGTLTITGSPPPALIFRGNIDRHGQFIRIDSAEVTGLGTVQTDAGMIQSLKELLPPLPPNLASIKEGAFLSLDKIAFTGRIEHPLSGPIATGTFTINGLDFGAPAASSPPTLLNLTFKGSIDTPLWPGDLEKIQISDGQLLAEKLTLGPNSATGISAALSLDHGRASITQAALSFADGKLTGDAALTLPLKFDSLHLHFTGVSQEPLSQNLYPDSFSAQGKISGNLSLARNADQTLTGSVDLTADQPGHLKVSRQAGLGSGIADTSGLIDYPYEKGATTLRDDAAGLHVQLDYSAAPARPNEITRPDLTASLTLHTSITAIIHRLFSNPNASASRQSATQPTNRATNPAN